MINELQKDIVSYLLKNPNIDILQITHSLEKKGNNPRDIRSELQLLEENGVVSMDGTRKTYTANPEKINKYL